jgi:hypothetical protein
MELLTTHSQTKEQLVNLLGEAQKKSLNLEKELDVQKKEYRELLAKAAQIEIERDAVISTFAEIFRVLVQK